jgi:hypothetical protein
LEDANGGSRSAKPDGRTSEDFPFAQLLLAERRVRAADALARYLKSNFQSAGAIYQALSDMLKQAAWRVRRRDTGHVSWSWSLTSGAPGGPHFVSLLQCAMCAFLTHGHAWKEAMKLGKPKLPTSQQKKDLLAACRDLCRYAPCN